MPERALSTARNCVSVLEKEVAVGSDDATKLAKLMLLWSGLKTELALSIVRVCVAVLEKEVALSDPASSPLPSPPASLGPVRNSCLNALTVALNETCDGKSWYTSTKELQMASLEFCIVCRSYQTLHLKVDKSIPRRLLAAADAPQPHPKRLCWTRVPRLRARSVTWNMPTAAELRKPVFAMTAVDSLMFGNDFEGSIEAVAWPLRPKKIQFHAFSRFNQPIAGVILPSSLIHFDLWGSFNQPIENVAWPPFLEQLVLGEAFDQPIELAKFPVSLTHLIFEQSSFLDQPIEHVAWPNSLQRLAFGQTFNQPVERVAFPGSLQSLRFGLRCNQPINGVSWPDSLLKLNLAIAFNHSIGNVKWPTSLQELSFGFCVGVGNGGMMMYSDFNQGIGNSAWPPSLRYLTLGHKFRQSLQGLGTWMPNLEKLCLLDYDSGEGSLLRGIEWPKNLRQLAVFEDSNLEE